MVQPSVNCSIFYNSSLFFIVRIIFANFVYLQLVNFKLFSTCFIWYILTNSQNSADVPFNQQTNKQTCWRVSSCLYIRAITIWIRLMFQTWCKKLIESSVSWRSCYIHYADVWYDWSFEWKGRVVLNWQCSAHTYTALTTDGWLKVDLVITKEDNPHLQFIASLRLTHAWVYGWSSDHYQSLVLVTYWVHQNTTLGSEPGMY